MATEEDRIRLRVEEDSRAVEEARRRVGALKGELNELQGAMDRGVIGGERYRAEWDRISAAIRRAQQEASKPLPVPRPPTGNLREQLARNAFPLANIGQDVAQGGPASAINNLLQPQTVKGIAELGKSLLFNPATAGIIVGLGGAFVVLDQGLKSAQLSWSDLDDVVANLGPFRAFKETFAGLGQWLAPVADGISDVYDAVAGGVNWLADTTVGWNEATEAAKAHREEVERTNAVMAEYAEATKKLKGFKSDDQQDREAKGRAMGQALADMGGAGGIDAVVDKLAAARTAKGGDDQVTRGDVTKTRREWAKVDVTNELAKIAGGDLAALDRNRGMFASAGLDASGLDMAARTGQTAKERARETEELNAEGLRNEQAMLAEREKEKRQEEQATREASEKARGMTPALDKQATTQLMLAQLSGATAQQAGQQVAESLARYLQAQGMSAEDAKRAAGDVVKDDQKKLADAIQTGAMNPPPVAKPEIVAAVDFAKRAQAGAGDPQREHLDVSKKMLDQLTKIARERGGVLA